MENKITNSKARNASVDIFRLICAILVVSIHTIPFKDINPICQFIFTQVIVRIAVPFFFAISGYFYIKKLIQGKKPFFPYFKSLLTVYVLWSAIYFLKELAATIYNKEDFLDFLLSFFKNFFIYGSSYHLWFFQQCFSV